MEITPYNTYATPFSYLSESGVQLLNCPHQHSVRATESFNANTFIQPWQCFSLRRPPGIALEEIVAGALRMLVLPGHRLDAPQTSLKCSLRTHLFRWVKESLGVWDFMEQICLTHYSRWRVQVWWGYAVSSVESRVHFVYHFFYSASMSICEQGGFFAIALLSLDVMGPLGQYFLTSLKSQEGSFTCFPNGCTCCQQLASTSPRTWLCSLDMFRKTLLEQWFLMVPYDSLWFLAFFGSGNWHDFDIHVHSPRTKHRQAKRRDMPWTCS